MIKLMFFKFSNRSIFCTNFKLIRFAKLNYKLVEKFKLACQKELIQALCCKILKGKHRNRN
ncbi:hypothetical protein BpHYR1_046216 [Brachionus plicatilis]|uniref:Uncharacterized protein n=1 Tax=Brachionus plicatilis TaxID=10195 RepID=A0A3M7SN12_BRAPC|nr:hypothetical protein BpHYR1_046216 [Brachionus plicatilis]